MARLLKNAVIALFLAALIPSIGGALAETRSSQEGQRIREETERALLRMQTEMPEPDPAERENLRVRERPKGEGLSGDFFKYLLWIAVGVVALLLAAALFNAVRQGDKTRKIRFSEGPGEELSPQETTLRMDKAQLEADDLARLGRFAEAMHVLLLQSVLELRRRLDISIASSLTSREILRHVALAPKGREAFADIVGRVEISWFGGRSSQECDYAACRQSFEILSMALQDGGAR